MLHNVHFNKNGGNKTFAACALAPQPPCKSGHSSQTIILDCCNRSNGGYEPLMTDAAICTKVCFRIYFDACPYALRLEDKTITVKIVSAPMMLGISAKGQ